ncbi:hypothetical protein TWF481_001354 [Arthrobotrys musiformis]|uniref:Uncharacterized protein n=1 Tax=Arthrobotrys musiformis TaxID=47236 RepID=A0AAV9WQK1_9PEZI
MSTPEERKDQSAARPSFEDCVDPFGFTSYAASGLNPQYNIPYYHQNYLAMDWNHLSPPFAESPQGIAPPHMYAVDINMSSSPYPIFEPSPSCQSISSEGSIDSGLGMGFRSNGPLDQLMPMYFPGLGTRQPMYMKFKKGTKIELDDVREGGLFRDSGFEPLAPIASPPFEVPTGLLTPTASSDGKDKTPGKPCKRASSTQRTRARQRLRPKKPIEIDYITPTSPPSSVPSLDSSCTSISGSESLSASPMLEGIRLDEYSHVRALQRANNWKTRAKRGKLKNNYLTPPESRRTSAESPPSGSRPVPPLDRARDSSVKQSLLEKGLLVHPLGDSMPPRAVLFDDSYAYFGGLRSTNAVTATGGLMETGIVDSRPRTSLQDHLGSIDQTNERSLTLFPNKDGEFGEDKMMSQPWQGPSSSFIESPPSCIAMDLDFRTQSIRQTNSFPGKPSEDCAPLPRPSSVLDEGYHSLIMKPQKADQCGDTPLKDLDFSTPASSPDLGIEVPETYESSPICIKDLCPSSEDEDSGYREERAVKVVAMYILTQYFLLQEYHLRSQSASTTPFSRSSSSAENYSDSQPEQCDDPEDQRDNGGREGGIENTGGPERSGIEGNQTQESLKNPQKRKMDEKEDGGREDEDDQRPNKRRSKNVDLNSLGRRLACPFAKGNPESHLACVLIGRQDLPGVKEHLKRNHFDKTLPPNIRACKTWEQVFRACIPNWDNSKPVPSCYLDLGFEILRPFTGMPLPKESPVLECGTPQHLDNSARLQGNIAIQPEGQTLSNISTTAVAQSSTVHQAPGSEGIEGAILPTSSPPSFLGQMFMDEPGNSMGDIMTWGEGNVNIQETLNSGYQPNIGNQFDIPQAFNGYMKAVAAPHMSWPLGPKYASAFNTVPSFLRENIGFDPNVPPAEAFPALQDALNVAHTMVPFPGTLPTTIQATFPSTPNLRMDPTTQFVSPLASTPGLTQSSAGISPVTTIRTPPLKVEPASNRYSLIVARKRPDPDSTEPRGPKLFEFDNWKDFEARFENWLVMTFTDPNFTWETMEFEGSIPEVPSRLSDLQEVLMDLRLCYTRYRVTDATLLLVSKEKGKQKASP